MDGIGGWCGILFLIQNQPLALITLMVTKDESHDSGGHIWKVLCPTQKTMRLFGIYITRHHHLAKDILPPPPKLLVMFKISKILGEYYLLEYLFVKKKSFKNFPQ